MALLPPPSPGLSGTLSELLQAIDGFADFMSLDLPGAAAGGDQQGLGGGSGGEDGGEVQSRWQPDDGAQEDLAASGDLLAAGSPAPAELPSLDALCMALIQQHQQAEQAAMAAAGAALMLPQQPGAPSAHLDPYGTPPATAAVPSASAAVGAGQFSDAMARSAPAVPAYDGLMPPQKGTGHAGVGYDPSQLPPHLPAVPAPAAGPAPHSAGPAAAVAAAAPDPAPKLSKQQRRDLSKAARLSALERQLEEQQERLRQLTLQNRALVLRERVLQEVARCRGELEGTVKSLLATAASAPPGPGGDGLVPVIMALAGQMARSRSQSQSYALTATGSSDPDPGSVTAAPAVSSLHVDGGDSADSSTAAGRAAAAASGSASPFSSSPDPLAVLMPGNVSPSGLPTMSALKAHARQWIAGLAQILVEAPPGSPEVEARLRAYMEPMVPWMITANLLNPLVYQLHVDPMDESLPPGAPPESHWRGVCAHIMPSLTEAQGELWLAIYDVFKSWHARVLQHRQVLAADLAAATTAAGAGGGAAPEVVAVAARLERNVRQQRLLMVLLEWLYMCPNDGICSFELNARSMVACYPWPPDAMALLHAFEQMWPQHLQERRRRQSAAR